jgi:hypothetical protein
MPYIDTYKIQGPATTAMAPNTWTMEYTVDGTTWQTADTQTGITFTAAENKTFTLSSTIGVMDVRMNVTANNGHAKLSIKEFGVYMGVTKQYFTMSGPSTPAPQVASATTEDTNGEAWRAFDYAGGQNWIATTNTGILTLHLGNFYAGVSTSSGAGVVPSLKVETNLTSPVAASSSHSDDGDVVSEVELVPGVAQSNSTAPSDSIDVDTYLYPAVAGSDGAALNPSLVVDTFLTSSLATSAEAGVAGTLHCGVTIFAPVARSTSDAPPMPPQEWQAYLLGLNIASPIKITKGAAVSLLVEGIWDSHANIVGYSYSAGSPVVHATDGHGNSIRRLIKGAWVANDEGQVSALAVKAAVAGTTHVVTGIIASSDKPGARATLYDGVTVIASYVL